MPRGRKKSDQTQKRGEKRKSLPIKFTDKAIEKFKAAIEREQQPKGTGIRIRLIQASNGYRYDLQFERRELPEDITRTIDGVKFFVDSFTATYLSGTEIDYQEFPDGWGGFLFKRPEKLNLDDLDLEELFNV